MIRKLKTEDLEDVREIFYHSFSEDEASVNYSVIRQIMGEISRPLSLCLGYEQDQKIVGAVAFSPVYFDAVSDISTYILAPLAVHNAYQKRGIATQLIEEAKSYFRDQNVDTLLVYGDPQFYGRYGFEAELGRQFVPPYPLEYEFGWQAMMLSNKDISGIKLHFKCVDALSNENLW